ncbi:PilZ domain-containing protein [Colwellia piezophila]|uniref:PilZ domain-containing protein n=1 Tax=Colwellia piezophila TaxID=211668 RepID=UPI000372CBF9|nr:PilZ domain-containing protein [Colwellia piezophila]
MQVDKREYPRFTSSDLNAVITISPPPPDELISLEGIVLDMSHKGIKIKLHSAMPHDIPTSKILINIVMPKSGLQVKIHGIIRHMNDKYEYGINYHKDHDKDELENLLFECVKVH